MEPRLVDSLGLGDLQKVSLGVLENQSFVPTTAQSLFILNVFHEGTRAAKFFHHQSKLSFRNDKRVPRIRSRAIAFGQGGFSLGKQSDMVLPQFHEYAIHVWAVEPLQGPCPENLRVKLLGPVGIHHCQDKVIQVPDIAFGLCFSSHFTALPFLLFYRTQKLSNKALTTNLPFFTLAPAPGRGKGEGAFLFRRDIGKHDHLFLGKVNRNFSFRSLAVGHGLRGQQRIVDPNLEDHLIADECGVRHRSLEPVAYDFFRPIDLHILRPDAHNDLPVCFTAAIDFKPADCRFHVMFIKDLAAKPVHRTKELRHLRALRVTIELVRIPDLQDFAMGHDRDAVGQHHGFDLIMGHVKNRNSQLAYEFLDLRAHLFSEPRIKVAERFVHQQQPGIDRQRAGESHPLLLAATQQSRGAFLEVVELHQTKSMPDSFSGLVVRKPRRTVGQYQANGLGDGHVRPDRVGLKHHADFPLLRRKIAWRTGRKDEFVVERDPPRLGFLHSRYAAHQRGLPRTARSKQDKQLFFADLKIDAVQGRHRLLARFEVLAQTGDSNHSASSRRLLRPTIRYSKTAGNMKPRITRLAAAA